MAKPFKFRYVREIVGSFMLAIIILLVAGIVLAGRAQGWFEPSMTLRVRIPSAGLAGLHKGSPVMTLGTKVGLVKKVQVNEDESLEAILALKGDFIRFIRSDSKALIKKQFGVAGDSFIELTRGEGAELEGEYLPSDAQKDEELVELAQKLVVDVQQSVLPLLDQVLAAAKQYTDLGAELQKSAVSAQTLIENLNGVAEGLNEGEGSAGKLLKDPQTVDELNRLIADTGGLLSNLNTVVVDVTVRSTGYDIADPGNRRVLVSLTDGDRELVSEWVEFAEDGAPAPVALRFVPEGTGPRSFKIELPVRGDEAIPFGEVDRAADDPLEREDHVVGLASLRMVFDRSSRSAVELRIELRSDRCEQPLCMQVAEELTGGTTLQERGAQLPGRR